MKKIIAIIAIILGFGLGVNAQGGFIGQSDGFFNSGLYNNKSNANYTELPRIPDHNLDTNQNAPLGSGLLLLAGMGLAYGVRRKMKAEN